MSRFNKLRGELGLNLLKLIVLFVILEVLSFTGLSTNEVLHTTTRATMILPTTTLKYATLNNG